MRRTWVIYDVSHLGWRAFFTTGHLSYDGKGTGVLYGIFQTILDVNEAFNTRHAVFAFDGGGSLRKQLYPSYKANRDYTIQGKLDPRIVQDLRDQIMYLRRLHLPEVGFVNVFRATGYEADDVIASVCANVPKNDTTVIVSSDKDLYQLLRPGVVFYDPIRKQTVSHDSFAATYGVAPDLWWKVKAIAGCVSDNIPGCHGAGEATALKYCRGEVFSRHTAVTKIKQYLKSEAFDLFGRLIRLPFDGTPDFTPGPQPPIRQKDWDRVMKSLGMASLRGRRMPA